MSEISHVSAGTNAEFCGTVAVREGDKERARISGRRGMTVMEIIRDSGAASILALCNGCCSCATCHVYVDEAYLDRLPAMQSDEDDLLDGSGHRRANSRLSCQIPFTTALDGLQVEIAPED